MYLGGSFEIKEGLESVPSSRKPGPALIINIWYRVWKHNKLTQYIPSKKKQQQRV
jgi:hypothetical protein